MKQMTTARALSESVTDSPRAKGKHTLYPLSLGHLKWLTERGNKVLMGKPELSDVIELCFAITSEPHALQSIKGAVATKEIEKFGNRLSSEDFGRLQSHAENELLKYAKTLTIPKKKENTVARPKTRSRVAKR